MQAKVEDVVVEWLEWRKSSRRVSVGTHRADVVDSRKLTKIVGGMQCRSVTGEHMQQVLVDNAHLQAGARNRLLCNLNSFFDYCRLRKYIPRHSDPMAGIRAAKPVQKVRQRIPPHKFPALLDATDQPRDRAYIALALYLLLRPGECRTLRIRDVRLDAGRVRVTVHKGGGSQDEMPICSELDVELRRWLVAYQELVGGPLDPDWYLLPQQRFAVKDRHPSGRFISPSTVVNVMGDRVVDRETFPTELWFSQHRTAQRAMEKIGIPIVDSEGKSLREGGHTFRRSASRGLFDMLVEESYDGALRYIQALLHHSKSTTTEIYLGLTLDVHKRDQRLLGKPMFGALTDPNVIPITGRPPATMALDGP